MGKIGTLKEQSCYMNMKIIQGASRNKLEFSSLGDLVSSENPLRVMDLSE